MRLEIRKLASVPRGLACVAESPEESELLDQIFGNKVVDRDGLIGIRLAECRLSDGCGEHYVYIDAVEGAPLPEDAGAESRIQAIAQRMRGYWDGPHAMLITFLRLLVTPKGKART